MVSHDLKYPDIIEMLMLCQDDDELSECFDNIVQRVALKDDMPLDTCRSNLLVALHHHVSYYSVDVRKTVHQIIEKLDNEE